MRLSFAACCMLVAAPLRLGAQEWVPVDFDAPAVAAPRADLAIPPPIVAPRLPPRGHWILRSRRSELITGIAVAGGTWIASSIIGLATHDDSLCVPIVGPILGTLGPDAPPSARYVAIYGAGLLIAGVGLQALFGPLYLALGLQRHWKWIPTR